MKKYRVDVEWAGHSRGESSYIVEAETMREAMDNYYMGVEVERITVRDDTEGEAYTAELIEEE